ncbi:MAG TPA: hypothetical protein VFZ34_26055, partial [Blastocatellia bacterium]|nr:hypothetical protein [Blastocatellia bacterium]
MIKQLKLLSGFVLFAVMSLYWATATWVSLSELWRTSDYGMETKWQDNKVIISGIKLENYSPILHPGDEIVGIRGMDKDSARTLLDGTINTKPGSETVLLVKCAGELYEVPVTTKPLPVSRWVREVVGTFAPWTFLLTGLIVFLLRHNEPQAWLLAMMLGAFVGLFNVGLDAKTTPQWVLIVHGLAHLAGILFFPLFATFFFVFPERDRWLQRWPRLLLWLSLPFFLVLLPINTLGRLAPYTD